MRWLVLAAALAACGDAATRPDAGAIVDADPSVDAPPAREIVTATQSLAAGEIIEGIFHGGRNDLALIHLEAPSATLDWNLHGHANGGTQNVHEELAKMTVDYAYTPSATADWWLLMRNGGATNMDVKVTIRLYGEMTWRWQ